MNVLVASDLFEVEYKGVYPLNIRFETKKPFASYVYGITFQNVLKNQFKGKETSLGRISFAEQCWSEFSQFDIQHLKNFVFVWFPYSSHSKEELIDLKKDLIQKLRPFCNG